ncbi:helix-turn-helix transcriptional regulator [Hydrogenophaga sp.]|uniref:helix-turn-helix transcriptional regulator n=1 Tax=Hydrogenophaga sp. TaxID=1904254 RepID=UPI0035215290
MNHKATRILRRPEVLQRVGLSRTAVYNLQKAGAFPAHVLITPRCAGWLEAEIDEWIESRRSTPAAPAFCPTKGPRKADAARQGK